MGGADAAVALRAYFAALRGKYAPSNLATSAPPLDQFSEPLTDPDGCSALTEPAAPPEALTVLPAAALPAGAVRDGWLVAGS